MGERQIWPQRDWQGHQAHTGNGMHIFPDGTRLMPCMQSMAGAWQGHDGAIGACCFVHKSAAGAASRLCRPSSSSRSSRNKPGVLIGYGHCICTTLRGHAAISAPRCAGSGTPTWRRHRHCQTCSRAPAHQLAFQARLTALLFEVWMLRKMVATSLQTLLRSAGPARCAAVSPTSYA